MSNQKKISKKSAAKEARQKRLAEALRQNLAKRKSQTGTATRKDSD